MSACLATADAARGLTVGVHGTTFGGNPLAMAIGNAVLDVVLAPGFIERVARLGLDMRQRLAELKDRRARVIEEIRGEGLMIGLKLKVPPANFAEAALGAEPARHSRRRQCRAAAAAAHVTEEELAEGVRRLDAACVAVVDRLLAASRPDQSHERPGSGRPAAFPRSARPVDRRAAPDSRRGGRR